MAKKGCLVVSVWLFWLLFLSLLLLRKVGSFTFSVGLEDDWECIWPRPQRAADDVIMNLTYSNDTDMVDCSALVTLIDWRRRGSRRSPRRCMVFSQLRLFLRDLISNAFGVKVLKPFVGQVAWQVALALENHCSTMVAGKSSEKSSIQLRWATDDEEI